MRIHLLVCLLFAAVVSFAQDQNIGPNRNSYHYIGIQANQLIKQILNFGGSTTTSNPYLLNYAVNSKITGVGFTTALGYNYNQSLTNDGFTKINLTSSNFAWRFGLEKKRQLSKHWIFSLGADVVIEADKTETKTESTFGGSPVTTENKTTRGGLGPRASLYFVAGEHLLIGTEASYYLKWATVKQTSSNSGQPSTPDSNLKSFQLSVPAAIFLTMRF